MTLVETDEHGSITLPGHTNEIFLVTAQSDGSIHLQPVVIDADAQEEYDTTPELQELLQKAFTEVPVRHRRR